MQFLYNTMPISGFDDDDDDDDDNDKLRVTIYNLVSIKVRIYSQV